MNRRLIILLCGCLVLIGSLTGQAAERGDNVKLTRVRDGVWVHTSYYDYNGYPTPSNGVVVETDGGLVLIDTAWTNEQTRVLLNSIEQQSQKKVTMAIITHAHQDRMGGIDVLFERGIDTISTPLTAELAERAGYKAPRMRIDPAGGTLRVGGLELEVYYPGPAHTRDNVAVYLPKQAVLFGGCIVKAVNSTTLGNTAEGDALKYPESLQKLIERYPNASVVIPGHGEWGGVELLQHTLGLAQLGSKP